MLPDIWNTMTFTVPEGRFVLVRFEEEPVGVDFVLVLATPDQWVRERNETTLPARAEHQSELLSRHPGARVAGELARARIPIGAVCGFSRDQLFIDERYLARARERLTTLLEGD